MAKTPTLDMAHDKPVRNYSARYMDYLNDHHRRFRKSVGAAPNDAAGLLGGTRYHGRETPVKGKGQPPASDKQDEVQHHKHHVPGRSYLESDILMRRPATADATLFQSSRRTYGRHLKTSGLQGAAVNVVSEAPQARAARGHGALAPDNSINNTSKHITNAGYTDMEAYLREGSGRRCYMPVRPNTADTVIRHRYSDPDTEAKPAKLDCTRLSTPTTKATDLNAERSCFLDAFQDYCRNKTRALYGNVRRFS